MISSRRKSVSPKQDKFASLRESTNPGWMGPSETERERNQKFNNLQYVISFLLLLLLFLLFPRKCCRQEADTVRFAYAAVWQCFERTPRRADSEKVGVKMDVREGTADRRHVEYERPSRYSATAILTSWTGVAVQ